MTRMYRKLSTEDQRRIRRAYKVISSGKPTAGNIAMLLPDLNTTTIAAYLNREMRNRPKFRTAFSKAEDRRLLQLFDECGGRISDISDTISREGVTRSAATIFNRLKRLRLDGDATTNGFPPSEVAKPGEAEGSYPAGLPTPPRVTP